MSDLPVYVLDRVFDAPPDLVWRSWTEKDYLAHWYGPGVETIIHRLDVAPGGVWLNEMRWGGTSHFQRADFVETERPTRLVFRQSVTDADWNVVDNPMMPGWPRVLLTTVTFRPDGEGTAMRLTWEPHEASQVEIDTFAGAIAGLDRGWSAGMDKLAELLAEIGG